MSTPIITICGRPNVGKSTLFNRMIGQRKSIVSHIPGTTRDIIQTNCFWNDKQFILVDSGGIDQHPLDEMTEKVSMMSFDSIEEASHVLFVVDATSGITNQDISILNTIRKFNKKISLILNKVDNVERESGLEEFYDLGLGEGIKISAYHGNGIYELMDSLKHLFSPKNQTEDVIKFSLVGRPNVGKSSLFNYILGDSKSIVDPVPGTTRDSIDADIVHNDENYTIVDTAGIRRKGKIGKEIEYYSVLRTVKAISDCSLSVLVIDCTEQVTAQDQHIAGLIRDSGNGCVVVVNKIDQIDKKQINEKDIIEKLKFFPGIPVVYTSATLNRGIENMFSELVKVNARYRQEFDSDQLWKNVVSLISENIPPSKGKKRVYPVSAKQIGSHPPKIQIKFKNSDLIHFSYKRYIENGLRSIFDLKGVPLQLEISES